MPTPTTKNTINISSEAFDELTGALNDKGIKLESDTEFIVKKDLAIKGPINYRQVNLRHQIMIEVAKVYKAPIDEREMEISDSSNFIKYLDSVYKYILTGEQPQTATTETKSKKSGWEN